MFSEEKGVFSLIKTKKKKVGTNLLKAGEGQTRLVRVKGGGELRGVTT